MTTTRRPTYQRAIPRLWWLRRRSYLVFMLRELTCVFVVWTVVFLLILLNAVGNGEASYKRFLDWADEPWLIALNLLTLAFLLFHSITWFNLAPKAMVVRVPPRLFALAPKSVTRLMPGRRVPAWLITAQNYAAWAVVSAIVAGLVLWSRS